MLNLPNSSWYNFWKQKMELRRCYAIFAEYTESLAEGTELQNQPKVEKTRKPLIDRCRPIAQQCRELLLEEVGDNVVREIFSKSKPMKKQCVLLLHDMVQYGEVSRLKKLSKGQIICPLTDVTIYWTTKLWDTQAHTQTFEKGGANLRIFTKGVRILRKFWFWGQS